eukprot:12086589-Heterocapsa_arctica.AAC.1
MWNWETAFVKKKFGMEGVIITPVGGVMITPKESRQENLQAPEKCFDLPVSKKKQKKRCRAMLADIAEKKGDYKKHYEQFG